MPPKKTRQQKLKEIRSSWMSSSLLAHAPSNSTTPVVTPGAGGGGTMSPRFGTSLSSFPSSIPGSQHQYPQQQGLVQITTPTTQSPHSFSTHNNNHNNAHQQPTPNGAAAQSINASFAASLFGMMDYSVNPSSPDFMPSVATVLNVEEYTRLLGTPLLSTCGENNGCNLPRFYTDPPKRKKWFEEDEEATADRARYDKFIAEVPQWWNDSLHMLLHCEFAHRRDLMGLMDNEFCVIVEQAWDIHEVMHLDLVQSSRRYWLEAHEEHDRNTIMKLTSDSKHLLDKRFDLFDLGKTEAAARAEVVELSFQDLDDISSQERQSYLAVRKVELDRAMGKEAEDKDEVEQDTSAVQTSTTQTPPPENDPTAPSSPTCVAPSSTSQPQEDPAQQPPARRQPRPPLGSTAVSHRHHTNSSSSQPQSNTSSATGTPTKQQRSGSKQQFPPPAASSPNSASASSPGMASRQTPSKPTIPKVTYALDFIIDSERSRREELVDSREAFIDELFAARLAFVSKASLHNVYTVLTQEDTKRRLIEFDYFAMLLSATCIFETLHRQEIDVKQRRKEYKTFAPLENKAWLQSRQSEQTREKDEELTAFELERREKLALVEWEQSRLAARRTVERDETTNRNELDHTERSERAILANLQDSEFGVVKQEDIRRAVEAEIQSQTLVWTEETSTQLLTSERNGRNDITRSESMARQLMQKAETESYILRRRDEALNEDMARPLRKYDDAKADAEWKQSRQQGSKSNAGGGGAKSRAGASRAGNGLSSPAKGNAQGRSPVTAAPPPPPEEQQQQ